MKPMVAWLTALYQRYPKIWPSVFFLGGFLWDSFTLTRIDLLLDNLILLGYLILLGLMIVVVVLTEQGRIQKPFVLKYRAWYPLVIQFLLGGLFSAYVVFYFKSASALGTYVFLSLLVILLIANEFMEKRLTKAYLLIPLYFLACFSFLVFFIPILTKTVSVFTFLIAGFISLILVTTMVGVFYVRARPEARRYFSISGGIVMALYLVMHAFYFQNWIPPVPLSMKEGGVYYRVARNVETNQYLLSYEPRPWYRFWDKTRETIHYARGDTVWCFASIFAPTDLTKPVYHHWQRYLSGQDQWETTDRIQYKQALTGGREEGYRGYTFKRNMAPGRWRVDIKTTDEMTLGRINFTVVPTDSSLTHLEVMYR